MTEQKETFEKVTTQKCPKCKEDLLIKRQDKSKYCQTCGYDTIKKETFENKINCTIKDVENCFTIDKDKLLIRLYELKQLHDQSIKEIKERGFCDFIRDGPITKIEEMLSLKLNKVVEEKDKEITEIKDRLSEKMKINKDLCIKLQELQAEIEKIKNNIFNEIQIISNLYSDGKIKDVDEALIKLTKLIKGSD